MANARWDAATATAVTLSNGNLTATNTGSTSADQGAHVVSTDGKATGKYYFETNFFDMAGGNYGAGVGTTASTYTGMGGNATAGGMVFQSGNIYANGANTGSSLGLRANGDIIGIAADLDNRRIWFRVAPSGNWNNSGTANPATNVGGFTIPAGTMVPFCTFGGTGGFANADIIANFGDTAFTGATPAGFTVGWPSLINTNALATQSSIEHWLTTNPNAQTTQMLLEHWGSVASDNLQMLTTQVALEHWASVAEVSRGMPIVTMVM